MEVSLLNIKEDVNRYINIISNLLNVDVGVVDKNMFRVTGTGLYKNIDGVYALGSVYKNTLETGKTHIIENPRLHTLCTQCKDKKNCKEKLEISTPIYCHKEIIGVLGLVCFNDEQKNKILANCESYLHFTKQIAEFIGIKFFEYQENLLQKDQENTLKTILENINKGVIIIDKDNTIVSINPIAIEKLNLKFQCVGKKIIIITQNDYLMNEEVFKLSINNKDFTVVGKKISLTSFDNRKNSAFIFEDIKKINENIAEITNNNVISLNDIYGNSEATKKLKENILKIADTSSTVLITGESGTGKELVARSLHSHSNRKNKPFVVINCSAIPDSLLESELFGYVKGAFTGANNNGRIGKFELANTGVIFLDEIGDMPLYLQAKILRVIQEKKIERIGSNKSIDLDIKIIAATNVNLEEKIKEQKFRSDLYYRLNVIPFKLLPLRERKEDILPIIEKLIKKYNRISGKNIISIDDEVKQAFLSYDWPGNVRELENVIELMFNISGNSSILNSSLLPENISKKSVSNPPKSSQIIIKNPSDDFENFDIIEKNYILQGLEKFGNTTEGKKIISEKMGIGLTTLYRKLKRFGIE
ncbi:MULTISPECIES: sigma-54 interaction domain-containing protein [Fusobacterium]|uniref:sigma-54 interaction domain-containing protein n=1 Tax=Fusobacterium TaxID=848 RepID=UPI000E4E1C05|nr:MULTISPECIES: sigma 54-interacting transcriptional regulator [Fusobacterium]MCF2627730.1 sigma 54-interacting transcriptional regulator [Fusobacterium mortiferum]MCF2700531.1 sigma 54-interacting transcriptional regulator [Fusobacterium mortiferum]MCI7666574.1 sigma 54-interacting transcriptional regulator [Fusobacterium mortiferum]MDD7262545.1 sigma 54-interacting transcriptional regulator [Fusobacterium mortiferum]MDY2800582.1 sigma 54-interacting transcriptional regulator [Fusobacterium 